MTWFTVFMIFIIAICATAVLSVVAFVSGYVYAEGKQDEWIKKQANRMCERMLKEKIGKTLAGVNDGKKYSWKIHFDNDGEDKCSTTRFGVNEDLSDIVNLINRRAIQWGCDITCIEVKREDSDRV